MNSNFFVFFRFNSPIILLTENLRCLTGRPLDSFNIRSNALYKFGVLSATDTSENSTL